MWHETPASVHPHCFPPSMTRLYMTGLSIASRTCIQWCYSWPFSLPLSGMSAHLTFNDSVVVNIHTYWHTHTSVVPPDMLRVATCLVWVFRTPSLSGRHRYYLPSIFWYCKHVCIVLAPKGTVTIIIIKENYFTSEAVYMSNTLLAKHFSVFASFNFGCEGSQQYDAHTFQILSIVYTNMVHQLTHRCD